MIDIPGVIQTSQALKTPMMQELIADITLYSMMNMNRNTIRIIKTSIDGSTPSDSGIGTSDVDICTSRTPPYVCICNVSIVNIGNIVTGTTPSFRDTSECLFQ